MLYVDVLVTSLYFRWKENKRNAKMMHKGILDGADGIRKHLCK